MIVESRRAYDDSPLPPAQELMNLQRVDERIPKWLMDKADKEQQARIDFNQSRIDLAKEDAKHIRRYNIIALWMAFFIVILFLLLSFYLILNEQVLIGTIFVGGAIVSIVSYFLKARPKI